MPPHLLATALSPVGIMFSAAIHAQTASTATKVRSAIEARDQVRLTRVTPDAAGGPMVRGRVLEAVMTGSYLNGDDPERYGHGESS